MFSQSAYSLRGWYRHQGDGRLVAACTPDARGKGMKKRSVALASLILALTLGASVAVATAAAGIPIQPQHAAATQHVHAGDGGTLRDSGPASSAHPVNHGFFVSQAAHNCDHGAHAVHS